MKRKKLTKRQILNELLVLQDKQVAVNASQQRVWNRQAKIRTEHNQLAKELETICIAEAKKADEEVDFEEQPIFFKNHIFIIDVDTGWNPKTTVDIKSTKNV